MRSMAYGNSQLVILAGGSGSSLWPLSTKDKPKQFIDVTGCGRTLLQQTYDRFEDIFPPDNVWVVTNKKYKCLIREQLPQVPQANILLEPCSRNTAPSIAYVSWRIKCINPKANVVVTPSDHIVTDVNEFRRVIRLCMRFTEGTDASVMIGVRPTYPETGYGYIQADLTSCSPRNTEIFRIDSFCEKPTLPMAEKYISRRNFFWNAGIFVWNVGTIVNAFRVFSPQIGKVFEGLVGIYGTEEEQQLIDCHYSECENISVDYAIMEKVEEVYVCPATFGWCDVGSWKSLLMRNRLDLYGNSVISENVTLYETRGSIIYAPGAQKVVVQGGNNIIVANKDGEMLVCNIDEENCIQQFVDVPS